MWWTARVTPMMRRSLDRIGELVQDLMDLARGQLGTGDLVPQTSPQAVTHQPGWRSPAVERRSSPRRS